MIWHVVNMAATVQWSSTVIHARCCCARVAFHMDLLAKSRVTAIIRILKYEMPMTCLRFDVAPYIIQVRCFRTKLTMCFI